jgi:hypothetical protein
MTPNDFFRHVEALIAPQVAAGSCRILDRGSYADGLAADVTLGLEGLLARLSTERGDFWVDVTTPSEPEDWHDLLHVLVLVSGELGSREKVLVGKTPADLDLAFHGLIANLSEIVRRFSPAHISETKARLAALRVETAHPMLRR